MAAAPAAFNWSSFITRMKDIDKDYRQMALHDLELYLEKDAGVILETQQSAVLDEIFKCFSEKEVHSEVHTNAVRVLGPLIRKLTEANQVKLVTKLADTVVAPVVTTQAGAQAKLVIMRENASMGLKSIAESLASSNAAKTALAAVTRLKEGLASKDVDAAIRAEIYDVLVALVKGYGKQLADLHTALQTQALAHIVADSSADGSVRKKASDLLAKLSVHTSEELFAVAVKFVADGLATLQGEKFRQFVQLVNNLSRAAASRFGAAVAPIVALLLKELARLNSLDDDAKESAEADGTREQIFQCLESFMGRCSGLLVPATVHLVVDAALAHVAWDPSYCDTGADDGDVPDFEDDEIDEYAEQYADDSDASWRVRKASAKCLSELIRKRPDLLEANIQKMVLEGKLYLRFKERDEQVLEELLEVVGAAVRECKIVVLNTNADKTCASQVSGSFAGGSSRVIVAHKKEAALFGGVKDKLMAQLVTLCAHKVAKIKEKALETIRDLLVILGDAFIGSVPSIAQAVRTQLVAQTAAPAHQKLLPQLRTEMVAIAALVCSITVRQQQCLADAEQLAPLVLATIGDRNLKTVVAALAAVDELVNVAKSVADPAASIALSKKIFDAVTTKLKATDADQEVKRAATKALSCVLGQLEEQLRGFQADIAASHTQLLTLVKNETTRVAAIQCFVSIVLIRASISETVLTELVAELVGFLRKTDRAVRETAVRALTIIVRLHSGVVQKSKQSVDGIIQELGSESAALLSDKELFLAGLSLSLAEVLVSVPSAQGGLLARVVPATLRVLRGPLSQGQLLTNAGAFLRKLGAAVSSTSGYTDLYSKVLADVKTASLPALPNVAVAFGAVIVADADVSRRQKALASLTQLEKAVGVCCLGEAGHAGCVLPSDSRDYIIVGMTNPSEDVRSLAIRALGRAASAKANKDLIVSIGRGIVAVSSEAFYYFRAVKEMIVSSVKGDPQSSVSEAAVRDALQKTLLESSNREDDTLVDIIGECIGRLAPFNFPGVLESLATALGAAQSQIVQATIVCAVKYAVSGIHDRADEDAVTNTLYVFLACLQRQATVYLRKSTLQLISTVAIARPRMLFTELSRSQMVPALLAELPVDETLVQSIDLGPFKHRVDKGSEMRKIAFETLATLVDGLFSQTNSILDSAGPLEIVVARVVKSLALMTAAGTAAEYETEIHNQCRSMLGKLTKYPAAQPFIAANLPTIVQYLSTGLDAKTKEPQEQEKIADSIKYAIRCALMLKPIGTAPGEQQKAFNELIRKCEGMPGYADAVAMTH